MGLLYSLPVFTPEGTHVSPAQRNFHIHVYCSIVHKSQYMHSDKLSINIRTNRENVVFV